MHAACDTTHLKLRQRIVIWFVITLFSKNGFFQQNIGTLIRVIQYYATRLHINYLALRV